jgi:secreted Zn-dependent insulinase-like peptidase
MNLVVSGKHTLEQLESWVREKFSAVPNKDIKVPDLGLPAHPFQQEHLGVISKFHPI